MRVYHNFSLLPGSRSTFPAVDPDHWKKNNIFEKKRIEPPNKNFFCKIDGTRKANFLKVKIFEKYEKSNSPWMGIYCWWQKLKGFLGQIVLILWWFQLLKKKKIPFFQISSFPPFGPKYQTSSVSDPNHFYVDQNYPKPCSIVYIFLKQKGIVLSFFKHTKY